MKIRLISDLHLNHSSVDIKNLEDVDVLVLAGDMSPFPEQTASWIDNKVPKHIKTIYVPGNHEYEGNNFLTHTKIMKDELKNLENVVLLQNEVFVLNDVRFLGTTLWTDFAAFKDSEKDRVSIKCAMQYAELGISDFSRILTLDTDDTDSYLKLRKFTPMDAAREHSVARKFLSKNLSKKFNGKTVVITHFLPSTKCIAEEHMGSKYNAYFASNLEDLMDNVDIWMHGHTHLSVDINIKNTKVICNPRGYSRVFDLSENTNWQPNKDIVLDTSNTNSHKHKYF